MQLDNFPTLSDSEQETGVDVEAGKEQQEQ